MVDERDSSGKHRDPEQRGGAEPERVGPYRILERLGEGGMGVVYLAEQEEPVRRTVALKLVKLGMDTEQVLARFDVERQTLARMDHPNIARVYDAGVTGAGRPYFVMERVAGQRITEYCDGNDLSMEQRLELFAGVCDAVQHAHRKGIIHRDIKPSNVLVADQDGRPVPKIIDFGIAKSTDRHAEEARAFTRLGQLVGTPEYMSPEQAGMADVDVDTRSDVYSLGVVLYELLTGQLPFDRQSLREAGLQEIQRIIREVDPPRPSTRLSSLGDDSREVARRRRTDVGTLTRQLRRDLDWIVVKALEKDRDQRYDSAGDLARDVRRYLSDEPVEAGPPGAGYRARKFVRRHRVAVGVVAAFVVVLVAGVVGTTWQAVRATKAGREARKQAEVSRAVNAFLNQDLLASVAPEQRGIDTTVRQVLDAAAEEIGEDKFDEPLVYAAIRSTLGNTYWSLGELAEAEEHLRASFDVLLGERGELHPDTLQVMFDLGLVLLDLGRYDEAELLLNRVFEGRRAALGAEDPATLLARTGLGLLHLERGKYPAAEALLTESLSAQTRILGEDHEDTLVTKTDLARLRLLQGRNDEASRLRREVYEARRAKLGERHPDTLRALGHLAQQIRKEGRYDEAEPLYLEYYEGRREVLGEEHPGTLTAMAGLGLLYKKQGRLEEAEPLYVRVLETRRRVLGPEHPKTLSAMLNMASLHKSRGRREEGAELMKQVYDARVRLLGRAHPKTLNAMNGLASAYQSLGLRDAAGALYRESLASARREFGDDNPVTLDCLHASALWLWQQGDYDRAEPLALENAERTRELYGNDHPKTLTASYNLGLLYKDVERHEEAEAIYREVLEGQRSVLGEKHTETQVTVNALADLYYKLERYDEAWPLYLDALEVRRESLGPEHPDTLTSQHNLAAMFSKQDKLEDARALYSETLEARRRVLGREHAHVLITTHNLAGVLDELDRTAEAEEVAAECVRVSRKALPEGHWHRGVFLSKHGELLVKLQRRDEAETVLLEAHGILAAARGPGDRRTQDTVKSLIALYEDWERNAAAARWRAEIR